MPTADQVTVGQQARLESAQMLAAAAERLGILTVRQLAEAVVVLATTIETGQVSDAAA